VLRQQLEKTSKPGIVGSPVLGEQTFYFQPLGNPLDRRQLEKISAFHSGLHSSIVDPAKIWIFRQLISLQVQKLGSCHIAIGPLIRPAGMGHGLPFGKSVRRLSENRTENIETKTAKMDRPFVD